MNVLDYNIIEQISQTDITMIYTPCDTIVLFMI